MKSPRSMERSDSHVGRKVGLVGGMEVTQRSTGRNGVYKGVTVSQFPLL